MRTLSGVEIFAVGTWNQMKFVREDLEEIARNTNALIARKRHSPPLKLGHSEDYLSNDAGQPALGWVENLRVADDKLLADFVNVPDTMLEAIGAHLYRQVSVEMDHHNDTGWVMTAVAVLGADLPAVKTLEDLQAYLSDVGSEVVITEANMPHLFTVATPKLEGEPMPEPKEKDKDAVALQAQLDAANKTIQEFQAAEKVAKFTTAAETALAPLRKATKEGKLEPALLAEAEVAILSQKASFTEGSVISMPMDLAIKLAMSAKLSSDVSGAKDIDDPDKEEDAVEADTTLADLVEARMSEKNESWSAAFKAVSATNKDKLKAYIEQPYHDVADTRPVARTS